MSCSPSMRCLIFLVFVPLWAVVRSDGTSDVQSLTGSFGETLKLNTPDTLIGEYWIVWSHVQGGINTVLINYDHGEWEKNATDKHQLDEKTGSLIIRSLTANDSGLYERRLFKGTEPIKKEFNVTVVEPSSYSSTPAQTSADHSTAGEKPTTPPKNRIPWVVGVGVLSGFAVLLGVLGVVWRYRERIKARCERKKRFRVWYAPCDREDPGRSSRQETVTQDTAVQDTAVQDTAVQIQLCNRPPTDVQRYKGVMLRT